MAIDHEARAQDADRKAEAAEGRAVAARRRADHARGQMTRSARGHEHEDEIALHELAAERHDAGAAYQRQHAEGERAI